MGIPQEPDPSKLFVSLIYVDDSVFEQGLGDLRLAFGEMDFMSEKFPFDVTDYYCKEMGGPLRRHFVSFHTLISPSSLPDIKHTTNRLEQRYARTDGNRRINIDPGYLCLQHVILATTKGYTHRPYLREGIYADLTLIYQKGTYRPLPWTYPDYRQPEIITLFNSLRRTYADTLKRRTKDAC